VLLDGSAVQVVRRGDTLVAGDGREVGVEDAVHLPPTEPSKIVAVHLNYASRTREFMTKLPPAPTYFHKPVTALNAHKGAVVRPRGCRWLNYEGEIVVAIGRTCRNVSPDKAGDYIAGYTIGNDFGLHDFRDTDAGSMLRVKGSDTLAPVGPGLVTGCESEEVVSTALGGDWEFRGVRTPSKDLYPSLVEEEK
jgi:5-oxopent-3-ene-1,2,5-tricarboxylate decarboxylase/2-hydroxyhepta-2,4-diene-1,7-dioate isomerase